MISMEVSKNLSMFLDDQVSASKKNKFLDGIPNRTSSKPNCVLIGGNSGVGKSTLIKQLVLKLRPREITVAVLAIDPMSSITGGAILGDRIRLSESDSDHGLFVRSIAYDQNAENFIQSLDYARKFLSRIGFDWVIIESYGLNQITTDLCSNVDKFVLVVSPFNGDDIQFMKSGILEQATHVFINRQDQIEQTLQIELILEALQISKDSLEVEGQITVGSAKNAVGIDALLSALN